MMLLVKVSPSFFVHYRLSMKARGCRGQMGRGMAVGQVGDNAMMGRGRNEVSSFLVFAKILVNTSKIQLLPSNLCIS
jgi:hypothetical protein